MISIYRIILHVIRVRLPVVVLLLLRATRVYQTPHVQTRRTRHVQATSFCPPSRQCATVVGINDGLPFAWSHLAMNRMPGSDVCRLLSEAGVDSTGIPHRSTFVKETTAGDDGQVAGGR